MWHFIFAIAGCILYFHASARAQQSYDLFQMKISDRAELVLEAMKEATTAVAKVKDKQTAEVAKVVLDSVDKRIKQYSERSTERTPAERRWVADIFIPKKEAQQAELDKAYDQVLARDPSLLPMFLDAATLKNYRAATEKRAKLIAENLVKACKAYYITFQKWPATLDDLVKAPNGKPFLVGGKDDTLTPWGKAFQYQIEKDATGIESPVISVANPFDGKDEIRYPAKEKLSVHPALPNK
jgi:hypothetical protein